MPTGPVTKEAYRSGGAAALEPVALSELLVDTAPHVGRWAEPREGMPSALWAETLKARRSKAPLLMGD